MRFAGHSPQIVLGTLTLAWSWCVPVPAYSDFEVESFTRYRLIRIDNNNNGYLDDFNIADQSQSIVDTAATEALERKSPLDGMSVPSCVHRVIPAA